MSRYGAGRKQKDTRSHDGTSLGATLASNVDAAVPWLTRECTTFHLRIILMGTNAALRTSERTMTVCVGKAIILCHGHVWSIHLALALTPSCA